MSAFPDFIAEKDAITLAGQQKAALPIKKTVVETPAAGCHCLDLLWGNKNPHLKNTYDYWRWLSACYFHLAWIKFSSGGHRISDYNVLVQAFFKLDKASLIYYVKKLEK
jgi:hypothetical protein